MEKEPVDTNATIITKDDVSNTLPQQDDDPKPDYSSKATTKTKFSDYLRIFTYSTWSDRLLLSLACLAEIGTGITLPLMNIIFGET